MDDVINPDCSPLDCPFCIQSNIYYFIVLNGVCSLIELILTTYGLYKLLFTNIKSNQKLELSIKLLIVTSNLLFFIASVAASFATITDNNCSYTGITYVFWQCSYGYQIGSAILIMLFIQRLHNAVKGSLFSLNQYVRFGLISAVLIQIIIGLFIVFEQFVSIMVWNILWYTERGLYVCTTLAVLYFFIKKFRSLSVLMRTDDKQQALVNMISKQLVLVLVYIGSTTVSVLTWIAYDYYGESSPYTWYIGSFVWHIDLIVNTVCLHAMFGHGIYLYNIFGCNKCSKKLTGKIGLRELIAMPSQTQSVTSTD